MSFFFRFFFLFLLSQCYALFRRSLFPQPIPFLDENADEPLFLTPYIESGQIEEARKLSR